MRSWMFIYIGLFAAIVVAANPVGADEAALAEPALKPIVIDSPISRADI